jgi:hypothetical protein
MFGNFILIGICVVVVVVALFDLQFETPRRTVPLASWASQAVSRRCVVVW